MTRRRRSVRAVLEAFGDSRSAQLHQLLRTATCPVDPVLDALPPGGTVLDIGCGHGLFSLLAALDDPGRTIIGADLAANKLRSARRAAERLGVADRVRFIQSDDGSLVLDALPDHEADAVLFVDVLYLLGVERAEALLRSMAGAVRPGGTIVVKEMSLVPLWKRRLLEAQEFVATRLASWTEGDQLELLPPARLVEVLESVGLTVRAVRLDQRLPHPHLLVIGDRAAVARPSEAAQPKETGGGRDARGPGGARG